MGADFAPECFGDLKVDFSGLKVDSRSCPYPVTTRTHSGGDLRTRCVVIKVSWWSAIRRFFSSVSRLILKHFFESSWDQLSRAAARDRISQSIAFTVHGRDHRLLVLPAVLYRPLDYFFNPASRSAYSLGQRPYAHSRGAVWAVSTFPSVGIHLGTLVKTCSRAGSALTS